MFELCMRMLRKADDHKDMSKLREQTKRNFETGKFYAAQKEWRPNLCDFKYQSINTRRDEHLNKKEQ